MAETPQDANRIISLIYETAEDVELWPKLLEACKTELDEVDGQGAHIDKHCSERELAVHLDRALRMNQRLEEMQNEVGSAKKVLDCLPMAIMTVDGDCQVISSNKLAQKVVSESDLLDIKSGFLISNTESNSSQLKQIVRAAVSSHSDAKNRCSIKLQSVLTGSVSVFAVKTTEQIGQVQDCCTLFIVSSFLSAHVSPEILRYMYQLTPAESRLAHKLVSGDPLKEIADQLGVTHNTARNQLKAIFAKTDTKRQSELVGLILSTPSTLDEPEVSSPPAAKTVLKGESHAKQSITLKDGRALCFFEFGDPNGVPVIYLHEFIAWNWWSLVDRDEFDNLGVRLIVLLRPGFLGTHLKSPISLSCWKDDFGEFVDTLNLESYHLLGFSSGGLFAIAAAYYFSDRCRGLALVSSSAPLETMSEMENVKPSMSRLIMGFAKFAPRLYQRFFTALIKTAQENTASYFRGYLSQWSDYDRNLTSDQNILQSLSDCFHEILVTDMDGLSNEAVICTRPWDFKLSDLTTPTIIWRGEEDKAVPYRLAEKLKNIPSSTTHVVPGMGHLFIYDYWHEIFSTLVALDNENEATNDPVVVEPSR